VKGRRRRIYIIPATSGRLDDSYLCIMQSYLRTKQGKGHVKKCPQSGYNMVNEKNEVVRLQRIASLMFSEPSTSQFLNQYVLSPA